MKVLLVHDHIFLTKQGEVYSNTFPYAILKRYIDIFSEITFVARHKEVEHDIEHPLSSGDGVNFVFLESISSLSSYFGLRHEYEKQIEVLMSEHDAVIVRLPSELGLLASRVAHRMHKKCLTEVVGCAWDAMWHYGGFKSKVYAPFLFMKMKNSVKNSDYTTYVTRQFLQQRYPSSNKANIIGVSDVELTDMAEEVVLKRIQKIEDRKEPMIFGTIASLNVHYKGIDIALQTLSEIARKYHHFEYHILGAGDPKAYIALANELGISDKVFFDGVLAGGEAVLGWLDSIDIYLQPSLLEGLPRSLVEAMSRACALLLDHL